MGECVLLIKNINIYFLYVQHEVKFIMAAKRLETVAECGTEGGGGNAGTPQSPVK